MKNSRTNTDGQYGINYVLNVHQAPLKSERLRKLIDILSHFLHGCLAGSLTGLFGWFGLAVALFLFIQFTAYEIAEERKIVDELYRELKEWAVGYALALIATVLLGGGA